MKQLSKRLLSSTIHSFFFARLRSGYGGREEMSPNSTTTVGMGGNFVVGEVETGRFVVKTAGFGFIGKTGDGFMIPETYAKFSRFS